MHLTSTALFLSAAASALAYPASFEDLASLETRDGPKSAAFACDNANNILSTQLSEMAKLKAQNISIPPYLAGYYSAISSGRQSVGCPDTISISKRFTPLNEPCDVVNEQHERMMELVDRFQKENIGVAPFIAGFLSAALDEHKALGCPAFTGEAAEEPVPDAADAEKAIDASARKS